MSGPLIFFMIVLVGDLILKTLRDKKKIERSKQERQKGSQQTTDYNKNQQKELSRKPDSIRNIMEILREEAEKKERKELEEKQKISNQRKEAKIYSEKQERIKKEYEDNAYWEEKQKSQSKKEKLDINLENDKKEEDIRKDLIRGIIFSEIISEPKSIKNQKRSM